MNWQRNEILGCFGQVQVSLINLRHTKRSPCRLTTRIRFIQQRLRDRTTFDRVRKVPTYRWWSFTASRCRKVEFGTGLPEKLFTKRLDFERHPELAELRDVRVAPHVLIDRSGNITQFVAFNVAAWHAGESIWHGRKNCNDVSIGIEMEGTDDTPYEDAQYTVLSELLYELMNTYPSLSLSGVVGHSEVAPGRKTDPGPHFDWRRVFSPLLGRRFDEARAVLRSSN